MRNFARFFITPKGERAARNGHPWVFGEEVTKVEGSYTNGDLVDVVTNKGKYLGTGFVNDKSKIRVRIISTNTNDKFDEAFWERRLRYALEYRRTVMGEQDFKCCRLIFGEADQFPGLTVDRFNDSLVTQTCLWALSYARKCSLTCSSKFCKRWAKIFAVYSNATMLKFAY